jgi:hypothetical protein
MGVGMVKTGILKQHFSIKIDYEKLNEYVMDKILDAISDKVDNAELWVEDAETGVVFDGSYTTPYREYSVEATRDEPAVSDVNRAHISEDCILSKLPSSIAKMIDVVYVDEPEECAEYEGQK